MMKILGLLTAILYLVTSTGCGTLSNQFSMTVDNYTAAASAVELGMTIDQVTAILAPTQTHLDNHHKKQADRYVKNSKRLEVHYYRSGWHADGQLTNDEYTPYLFSNERLVSIGWLVFENTDEFDLVSAYGARLQEYQIGCEYFLKA